MMTCRTRRLLLTGMLVLFTASCDSTDPEVDPPGGFERTEMLENIGRNIILPSYEALAEAVEGLDAAAAAFAGGPSPTTLTELRNALKTARLAWQDANLFQFGPAESVTLRAALNTYPVDESRIEANIESGEYVFGTIDNRAAVGFPALDYLLYGIGDTEDEIVSAYTDASNAADRLEYLSDVIEYTRQTADETLDEWSGNGGNYIGAFLSPARGGTDVGSSLGMLINAFVLHYERFVRDGKIGIPAGVRSAGVPRPSSTEAHYAGYSVELAIANVEAVLRLFLGNDLSGTEGTGLDDNLRFLDAGQLAVEIESQLEEALEALRALDDPLSQQIESDNDAVIAAFTELQDVVVLLKADLTSVLGITITYQDNDGD